MTSPIEDCTVAQLQDLVKSRELSATAIASATIDRLEALEPEINAFASWDRLLTLQQAKQLDDLAARGESAGPLHGVPIAAKDNYLTSDFPTSAGSLVEHSHEANDAASVANLRAQGALIIGKTNMHEWAYGATNEVSSQGRTCNPWSLDRITGGSSGGSGAAVAARVVPAALGSDTGGSVRIPASACGISGIKPTFGFVDVRGVLPLSWSFDVVGPMARTAEDLNILLRAMRGERPQPMNPDSDPISGLRIGRLSGPGFERTAEVGTAVDLAIEHLEALGGSTGEVGVPAMKEGFGTWKVILHAEAATYHGEMLATQRDRYSPGVRTQLEAGLAIGATDYLQAQRFRREFNERVAELFGTFDVLALPTLPLCAPPSGQHTVDIAGRDRSAQDSMTGLPWLANFTGLPAVSIPCGFGAGELPIGLSLIGRPGTDFELLEVADAFQQRSRWHLAAPAAPVSPASEVAG